MDDIEACDYCGKPSGRLDWLAIELARPSGAIDTFDYLDFVFCSSEHAGLYLQERKLPPVRAVGPPQPLTRWDRVQGWLIGIAIVAVLLWAVFLFGLGAWTFVRHVRGS